MIADYIDSPLSLSGGFANPVFKILMRETGSTLSLVRTSASMACVGTQVMLRMSLWRRKSFNLPTCSRIEPSSTCLVDLMRDLESVNALM